MRRIRAMVIVVFACVLAAGAGGCATPKAWWTVGVSWHDLSYDSLKELHEAGISSIEVTVSDLMKVPAEERAQRCEEIARTARLANIVIWSAHIPYGKGWDISVTDVAERAKALKNVHEAMEICVLLAPRKAVIHASAEPIPDDERQARLTAARMSLMQLTAEFHRQDIQLCLEDLPRTCLGNTSDEILWLTRDIDDLGVCFDTNHLLKEKPEEFARKVGGKIVTLHVSDYDGVDERHWMPGEGIIDWKAVAAALREAGYHGPFMFETSKHRDGTRIRPAELVAFRKSLQ